MFGGWVSGVHTLVVSCCLVILVLLLSFVCFVVFVFVLIGFGVLFGYWFGLDCYVCRFRGFVYGLLV